MRLPGNHCVYRNPAVPWLELRVSTDSADCYRMHTHAEFSVGIVDEGEAIFHHPSGPQRVAPGTVVLIEPDVIHACNPVAQSVWSYRMLFVESGWVQRQISARQNNSGTAMALHFSSRAVRDRAVTESVDRLCRSPLDAAGAAQQSEQMGHLLSQFLCSGAPSDQQAYPVLLEPALLQIHAGLDTGVTVRQLAQLCDMNPSQFTRQFKRSMGVAPAEYLQNFRVNGARRLIAHGVSLAEAAHAMGFSDQAHMQRAFKVRHAMTPGSYAPLKARSTPA
jgi:AraC-like DNA-binding protein